MRLHGLCSASIDVSYTLQLHMLPVIVVFSINLVTFCTDDSVVCGHQKSVVVYRTRTQFGRHVFSLRLTHCVWSYIWKLMTQLLLADEHWRPIFSIGFQSLLFLDIYRHCTRLPFSRRRTTRECVFSYARVVSFALVTLTFTRRPWYMNLT